MNITYEHWCLTCDYVWTSEKIESCPECKSHNSVLTLNTHKENQNELLNISKKDQIT